LVSPCFESAKDIHAQESPISILSRIIICAICRLSVRGAINAGLTFGPSASLGVRPIALSTNPKPRLSLPTSAVQDSRCVS
jgi:hypothetical protein